MVCELKYTIPKNVSGIAVRVNGNSTQNFVLFNISY